MGDGQRPELAGRLWRVLRDLLVEAARTYWTLVKIMVPVRNTYAAFLMRTVEAVYLLRKGRPVLGHQIIITNYRLSRAQLRAAPRDVTPIPKPRKRRP